MSRLVSIAALVLSLALTSAPTAWADTQPVGGCPNTFDLHRAADHDEHHEHKHVGTATDHNGDGWICVKHLANGKIHVHVDNNAAVP
jgi:hypothetical protein